MFEDQISDQNSCVYASLTELLYHWLCVIIPSAQPELEELLTVLVLCHTCHVERSSRLQPGENSHNGFDYEYQASSPDEKAFLEAARRWEGCMDYSSPSLM